MSGGARRRSIAWAARAAALAISLLGWAGSASADECDRLGQYPGNGQDALQGQISGAQCTGAVPYARLANDVYATPGERGRRMAGGYRNGGDWTRLVNGSPDLVEAAEDSGFAANIYENPETGEIVISFRGTEPTSGGDWWNNAYNGTVGNLPFTDATQYQLAAEVARRALEKYKGRGITFTGHSLGGGLANHALLAAHQAIDGNPAYAGTNVTSVVFNAAAMNRSNARRLDRFDADVQNIYIDQEPLHNVAEGGITTPFHRQVGDRVVIPITDACTHGDISRVGQVVGNAAIPGAGTLANAGSQNLARHSMDSVERELQNCIKDATAKAGETGHQPADDGGEDQAAADQNGTKAAGGSGGQTARGGGGAGWGQTGSPPSGASGDKKNLPVITYRSFRKSN